MHFVSGYWSSEGGKFRSVGEVTLIAVFGEVDSLSFDLIELYFVGVAGMVEEIGGVSCFV